MTLKVTRGRAGGETCWKASALFAKAGKARGSALPSASVAGQTAQNNDVLTQHTETNGNASILLKTIESGTAHSTLWEAIEGPSPRAPKQASRSCALPPASHFRAKWTSYLSPLGLPFVVILSKRSDEGSLFAFCHAETVAYQGMKI